MGRIVFAGFLIRFPVGGYAWQVAHYLLGLRQLGHDVWFYEDTGEWESAMAYNPLNGQYAPCYDYGTAATSRFFHQIGFGDRWVFVDAQHGREYGPAGGSAKQLLRDADLVIN